MVKKVALVIASMAMLAGFAAAQNTVPEIDKYVRSLKKVTSNERGKIVVADTADYESKKTAWKKFASEKALQKFRDKHETYSIAYNWKSGSKLVATHFTDFSPSGDWAQYTFHYFRPGGTIAKVEAELRTFNGEWVVTRDYYFDKSGKRIKLASKYLDLNTKKPKKPTKEMTDDANGSFEVTFFKTADKLPFAALVRSK
jgi:hypothetical protein